MIKKQEESTSNQGINPIYIELSTIYVASQFLDIQKLLQHLSMSCPYNAKYPILNLLQGVCQYLLINELESIFFAYVIETNSWNINDQIIKKYKNQVKEIILYANNSQQYKSLTLYLLLCGYTAKFYLNQKTEMYLAELEKLCSDFKIIFSQWVKQQAHTTLKINPQSLNKVYKKIFLNRKQNVALFDYNSLVDDILTICPSYNPSERQKYMEIQKQQKLLKSTHQHPMCISNTVVNLPILTSSGFLQQMGINPVNNSIIMTESIQPNKRPSFGLNSSEYGLQSYASVDDQNDIVELNIGFRECHSDHEDNVPKTNEVGGKKATDVLQKGLTNSSSYFY